MLTASLVRENCFREIFEKRQSANIVRLENLALYCAGRGGVVWVCACEGVDSKCGGGERGCCVGMCM